MGKLHRMGGGGGGIDFNVGYTQISQIICNKESIKSMYTDGMNVSFKYLAPQNMKKCGNSFV